MNYKEKEILSNYFDGELTPDEKKIAENLLAEKQDARQYLEELKEINKLLNHYPDISANKVQKEKFYKQLKEERSNRIRNKDLNRILKFSRRFAAAAAVLLIIVLSTFIIIQYHQPADDNAKKEKNIAAKPEVKTPEIEIKIEPDAEMFEYIQLLMSDADIDAIASLDEEDFDLLENVEELSQLEAAVISDVSLESE